MHLRANEKRRALSRGSSALRSRVSRSSELRNMRRARAALTEEDLKIFRAEGGRVRMSNLTKHQRQVLSRRAAKASWSQRARKKRIRQRIARRQASLDRVPHNTDD